MHVKEKGGKLERTGGSYIIKVGESIGRELRPFFQRNLTIKGKKEREKKECK